ncbi:UNVERIFIED_CONTAM: hypothetical protein NCL1_09899 [Trichonephila clavipes]
MNSHMIFALFPTLLPSERDLNFKSASTERFTEVNFLRESKRQEYNIVTSVQAESDTVDDETDEDEDNDNIESSKGPSNADECSTFETAMEWYEQQS